MDLYQELISIIETFNNANIDYAVCGGIAVALHGYPRFTKDLDFLVKKEDIKTIEKIVEKLGYEFTSGIIPFASGTPQARQIYRISKIENNEAFTLDFLFVTPIYEDIWEDRELFEWQGHDLQVVSKSGLVKMKQLAGRKQDLLDIEKLKEAEDLDSHE